MNLQGLNKRLKTIADFDAEKEIYSFLKLEIPHIVLKYNLEQLFIENVDTDGYILGYYSPATEAINPSKEAGTPFTMYDSGDFMKSIKIEIKYRKIDIFSTDVKYELMLASDSYLSTDFFGLTEENLKKLINKWIIPHLKSRLLLTKI